MARRYPAGYAYLSASTRGYVCGLFEEIQPRQRPTAFFFGEIFSRLVSRPRNPFLKYIRRSLTTIARISFDEIAPAADA